MRLLLPLLLPLLVLAEEPQVCHEGDEYCVATDENAVPKGSNEMGLPPEADVGSCFDRSDHCPGFAERGECELNPGWMTVNCPLSCNACHLLDPAVRCSRLRLNISTDPIYRPGDMADMFASIERDFGERYRVSVLSREPWVVLFDDFLTKEEADALVSTQTKWERSTDTGVANAFGEVGRIVSQGRTSGESLRTERLPRH